MTQNNVRRHWREEITEDVTATREEEADKIQVYLQYNKYFKHKNCYHCYSWKQKINKAHLIHGHSKIKSGQWNGKAAALFSFKIWAFFFFLAWGSDPILFWLMICTINVIVIPERRVHFRACGNPIPRPSQTTITVTHNTAAVCRAQPPSIDE